VTADAPAASTFLFADLAGYTALTEAHGDDEAADLAGAFCDAVRNLLPEYDAEDIKVIGDEVMVRGRNAAKAVRLALRIAHEVGARHGFPAVRIGMHTGPAVERRGDWFGATVNVAARVSSLASGGEILLTESTREAAGDLDDVELHSRGEVALRNVAEPIVIYAALRSGDHDAAHLPVDPVCRMAVDPSHCAGTLVHDGAEYHFCSLRCVRAFAEHPERYIPDADALRRDG
jgi:class 3 adenylate cyclase/YHS domain-containing protein